MGEDIDSIWARITEHFDGIKENLENLKAEKGELSPQEHKLTIEQVIKKIYEVM